MLRTLTLSLLLLVSLGVMLPIARSTAHGLRQSVEAAPVRKHYRRHSRAWWRRYRARLRARRDAAANMAALAHRNAPLSTMPTAITPAAISTATAIPMLPNGWNKTASSANEMKFKTESGNAAVPGQASLSVVALSRPNPEYLTVREQRRVLSGVALSDLRRLVIDKMVTSGGWVNNDYEREVSGHRVFIVTAQTPSDGRSPDKAWNFYFTEVNGRIYSLTTNTPSQSADRMAIEAEKFMTSLYGGGESALLKANR